MRRYIGDVHGHFAAYESIALEVEESIQVGDFGIGFGQEPPILPDAHRFIRGNHDNPEKCKGYPSYMGDYGARDNLFWVGGGYSIDRWMRKAGQDWWPDEELSNQAVEAALDLYSQVKPEIMVTHMCPRSLEAILFDFGNEFPNRTHQFLEGFLWIHRPKVWIFGHYHKPRNVVLDKCRFICLPELAYVDIDL